MNNHSVFCFHLRCGLGLYLLHTIQMLLRRQNYGYSFWLSTLFVESTCFLFSILSMVRGRAQVLAEDSLLYPEVLTSQNLEEFAEQGECPLTCPSSHNVAVRWRGYNSRILMGNEAQNLYFLIVDVKDWGASLFAGLQFSVLLNWEHSPWPNDGCIQYPGLF